MLFILMLSIIFASASASPLVKADICERDCSCQDWTKDTCHNPHPTTTVHTETIEECMSQCEVFAMEDRCKFIIYEYEPVKENCKIMNDDMGHYLRGCSASGQPLHKEQNELMEDCSHCTDCDDSCISCKDDPCFEYVDIGCDFILTPEDISSQESYEECVSHCKHPKQDFTYAFYDGVELGTCTCYKSGDRHCTGTAVSLESKDCIISVSTTTSPNTTSTTTTTRPNTTTRTTITSETSSTKTTTTGEHTTTTTTTVVTTTLLNTTTTTLTTTTSKEKPDHCENDCSCQDWTRDICHRPHPTTTVHTDTIQECMANCQVFALENRCKFIIYEYNPVEQNCHIMNDEMGHYLRGCSAHGQPLHKQQNELMEDCEHCTDCGDSCMSCKDDPCFEYVGLGCDFVLTPEDISNKDSYEECVSHCRQHEKDFTYAFYSGTQLGTCTCYKSGDRHCTGTAVSLDSIDCIP